ncbi:hypothetical protein BDZ89DRAFT_956960 [Hymenopellis radicata]|nr:hypothetical protein BDZ89DRAFT_956960 [Hymenopellis radicata]
MHEVEEWDISNVVVGPPTSAFRDNLRPDVYYLTAWVRGGFTNLFIGFTNMMYLAIISDRVPVVPPFAPSHHISHDTNVLPFGDVFDMDRLRAALRTPVLEWSDIKTTPSHIDSPPVSESLGCWTSSARSEPDPIEGDTFFSHLKLDVAYTRLPDFVYRSSRPEEYLVSTWPISSLIFPDPQGVSKHADTKWTLLKASPNGAELSPDVHLACFDTLYFMGTGVDQYDWWHQWGPQWRVVGKHLRFSEKMLALAREYVGKALGVSSYDLPPFITVHIRRGDFGDYCETVYSLKDCLAPLSAFQRRVHQVQFELLERTGVKVTRVIVSSDERDPKFWENIDALGWHYIDHAKERTIETYGQWYAPIIDVVIHSMGSGFVGTDGSTLSLVSQRRVQHWNGGPRGL